MVNGINMGLLKDFDLCSYGCDTYVETGTGLGVTLGKAYRAACLQRCYSVDIDFEWVAAARAAYPGTSIAHDYSHIALEWWLREKLPQEARVLFFLDAHFPGADYRRAAYDVTAEHAVPLRQELELIAKYRKHGKDYIICDDARIYMQGPFEAGNIEWLQVPGGITFVYELFPQAKIGIDFRETGYISIDRRI